MGTARSTLFLCRFLLDTGRGHGWGNGSVVPFERITFTTFKVYLIIRKGHLCSFSEHTGFE